MSWIDEHSVWLVLGSLAAVVALGFLWLRTGNAWLFRAVVLAGLLGVAVLVVEQVVVTDREAVTDVIHQAAAAVARNDLDGVLEFTHSRAAEVREQASAEMPNYHFHEVTIKANLEIRFEPGRLPGSARRAIAEFNATAVVSDESGALKDQRIPRFLIVTFEKENGKWRIVAYEHHPPQQGMMRRDAK